MGTIKKFENLEIWQEARRLSKKVNSIANCIKLRNEIGLRNQIRRSSGLVMDNIAEGFERDGNAEFRQFLSVAKGSAGELRSQIYRLHDNKYISEKEMEKLTGDYAALSRRISYLISYLNRNDFKGIKFKSNNKKT